LAYRGALRQHKRRGIQAPQRPFTNPVPLTARSVVTRRGPAPTPYYRAAGRRAPRSAPGAPRGSGRSRRAGPQRRTRPEARTQAQRPFRGVAWGPEITPPLPVETVGNSRVQTAGAARSGLSSGDVAARLYAVARGAGPPKRADSTGPTEGSTTSGVLRSANRHFARVGDDGSRTRRSPAVAGLRRGPG
jgi:hypothetical protein